MEGLSDAWGRLCRGSEGILDLTNTAFDAEALDFLTLRRKQQQHVPLTCIWFNCCRYVDKPAIAQMKNFLSSIGELRTVHVVYHRRGDVADTVMLLELAVASQACPNLNILDLDGVDLRGAQVATSLQDLFRNSRSLQQLQLCGCRMDDQAWEGVIRGIATREAEGGLQWLWIFHCEVDDARMQALAEAFCGSLSSSAALQNLNMGGFAGGLSASLPALVQLLLHCQNLQELQLNGSRIFDSAAAIATANSVTRDQCPVYESFLEAVQQHPSLQNLSVSGCGINKFMAAPLFGMLEHNTTLRELHVRGHVLSSDIMAQSVPHWKGLSRLEVDLDNIESPALQQALVQNVSLTSICQFARFAHVRQIWNRNRWLQRIPKLRHNSNNRIQASYWPFLVERLMQKVDGDLLVLHTFVLVTAQELFV